jgi:hypothetical protein
VQVTAYCAVRTAKRRGGGAGRAEAQSISALEDQACEQDVTWADGEYNSDAGVHTPGDSPIPAVIVLAVFATASAGVQSGVTAIK